MVRQLGLRSFLFVFVIGVVQCGAQSPYDPFGPYAHLAPPQIGDCMDYTGSTESCPEFDPVWCPAFCLYDDNPVYPNWSCYSYIHQEYVSFQRQPVSDSWDQTRSTMVGQSGYEVVDVRDVICEITADCICEWDGPVMRCVIDLEAGTGGGNLVYIPQLNSDIPCQR